MGRNPTNGHSVLCVGSVRLPGGGAPTRSALRQMPSAHQDAEISFPIVDDVKSLFRFGLQYGCGTTVIEITRPIRTGDNTILTSTTSSALAVKVNAWFCASMVSFGEAMREVLVK